MIIAFPLTILSAAMFVAAFPPLNAEFLAWAGLVPFFFALDGRTKRMAFLLGLLWGFVFFLGTVYWVVNSMVAYGGV
ncbi:MAG: apolipoprotein N-acyltransferase, partial [Nanoarchaeota archaeon]